MPGSASHTSYPDELNESEYNSLTNEGKYQAANKLLDTIFRGMPVDEFYDISSGVDILKLKAGNNFLNQTKIDISKGLDQEQRNKYDLIITDKNSSAANSLFPINFSVFLGYRMGRAMALEAGVTRLADMIGMMRTINTVDNDPATSHVAEETVDISLSYVALLGVWPLTENLAFQVRAGLASWSFGYTQVIYLVDNNTQALTMARVEAYKDTDFSGIYGAGFSYAVGDWIEISLKYEALNIKPVFISITAEDSVQLLSLGLMMHF